MMRSQARLLVRASEALSPGAIPRYLFAVTLAGSALLVVRALAGPLSGLSLSVPLAAVLMSGIFGTVGTSLVTMMACAMGIAWMDREPTLAFGLHHNVATYRLVGFLVTATLTGVVSGSLSRAYRRVAKALGEADAARNQAEVARALAERAEQTRTHALEEERAARLVAQRAEQEARSSKELQEQMMAVLGHDLRTPLAAVRLCAATLLRSQGVSEPQAAMLRRLENSSARMATMIADLLDFSRIRLGGGIPIQADTIDLGDLCRRAVDELKTVYPDRDIWMKVACRTTTEADRERLFQAVSNLIGNALQHGTRGVPVMVAVSRISDQVTVSVHNDRPVIPAEMLGELFKPFRRGSQASAEGSRAGSLGLGLFIVREVLKAHGGTVEVTSNQRDGTTFTLRLPVQLDRREVEMCGWRDEMDGDVEEDTTTIDKARGGGSARIHPRP